MGLGNNVYFALDTKCSMQTHPTLNGWDEPQREAPHPYTPPHLPYSWHLPPFPLQATHVTHWFSSRVTATSSGPSVFPPTSSYLGVSGARCSPSTHEAPRNPSEATVTQGATVERPHGGRVGCCHLPRAHLDDVQARLRVLQNGELLVDVHQANLIRVGPLAHQIDHLLQQAGAWRERSPVRGAQRKPKGQPHSRVSACRPEKGLKGRRAGGRAASQECLESSGRTPA